MSIKDLVVSGYESGQNILSYIRKVPAISSGAGFWVDLSMTTGNPAPNYYVGGEKEATIPSNWYKKGIYHGGAVSPKTKYLHKAMLYSSNAVMAPAPFLLCDYLMYYPLIDMDNTDEQLLDNSTTSLPRYTDGVGVQAFLVATNPYVGGARFQIKYTNTEDEARTSQILITNNSTFIGTIVNSNTAGLNNYQAFIPLVAGDLGIKSIQSITFLSPNGGLATLVLVRPIATLMTREATAWAEYDFIKDKASLPRIYDGAYLNLLVMPSGGIAAVPVLGEFTFIWN